MALLDFRKPNCVVLQSCISHSGKYKGFYGHHYRQGHLCYDVGAINRENGEITTRHYSTYDFKLKQEYPAAKAEALDCWQVLRAGLERKPKNEEYDERAFQRRAN